MLTLGIDPGTAITGYGIISENGNKFSLVECGCINTAKTDAKEVRLKTIYSSLKDLINKFQPKSIAVEELFFSTNTKTAISVGEARGVILLACAQSGIPIASYTPLQVKQAITGYGRAEKSQIQQMVKTLLNLNKIPKPDDIADALAIAICHANSRRFKEKIN